MNFDLPATISAITLLFSFISPIIVTVINNHHTEKITKYKEFDSLRTQAIVNYIRNTGPVISSPSDELYDKYRSAYGEIFLHISSNLWGLITELDRLIYNIMFGSSDEEERQRATRLFSDLCQALADELPGKEQKQRRRKAK